MNDIFEKIYRDYFNGVYAFIFKLTRDSDLSEELSQETFYQAFLSFRRFKGNCDIFTWLISIAKHTYYKYLRKNRMSLSSIDFSELEKFSQIVDENGNPADTIQQKDFRERITQFVNKLPQKYYDVVLLRIYADMPFSEVAAALDITENSAKVIFYRAKKILMEDLYNELNM